MRINTIGNKKYDSVSFAVSIYFKQDWKQRLTVKNSIKRLLNAIFWLDFLRTYLKISAKFV